ncbi:squalene/phytoene synthase family protein [Stakelama tenebrarum]|uniref:Squalene/phytoene synthase family protein n=1 Tax=Stakelama tenebrarum TaxID=2711215 RepID=A0A6G6Y5B0_9SPHN|nr:squalene/phytoene synthase family protein [Sphingosinithalassobacter tenebrarum]QIG79908.1 squalene/phytoene synthase family protein [Sphingosinithalassobacter tenebrarum]
MTPAEAERSVILTYAPQDRREGLSALLALDDALGRLLATTSEPALGQIRLQWWREALQRLDTAPPPAEPVLEGLARAVLPTGVTGEDLSEVIAGWDALIESETLDEAALARFAQGRGQTLFRAAACLLSGKSSDPVDAAGQGWALADLARHLDREEEAALTRALAEKHLEEAARHRWSAGRRALGALALLARRDLSLPRGAQPPVGSPARVARLVWHRLSGR